MLTWDRFWQWLATSAIIIAGVSAMSGCGAAGSGGGGGESGSSADAASDGSSGTTGESGGGSAEGSSDDGFEFGGTAQSVAVYRDTLTSNEAYHLLRRAAFGATPEQVNDAVRKGLSATVDDLLESRTEPDSVIELAELYEDNIPKRWLVYLLDGNNPLTEQLAIFWHDRFATSRRVLEGRDRGLAIKHWQMLRTNALGNYRDFLEELTIDPLMLIWLNGANSPKDSPNENYAREFWELFTLGRDVLYDEADIRESARGFTGITLLRESDLDARPIFDLLNHDETLKDVFPQRAQPANYNYISMIDLTLEQQESARYVARNLFEFFIHDHPNDGLINTLANQFANGGFEIEPLVRTLLTSQAMFSSEANGNQITSPVEHFVGVARTLDMHIYSEESQGYLFDQLSHDLAAAGQDLLNPPGVEGWSEGQAWLQDQWLINRSNALGRVMDYGPEHTAGLPFHLLPPQSQWIEREVRRDIVERIAGVFHLNLTEDEIDIYIEVLDQNGWRAFHLEEPDNQPRHVFEMIRLMAMDERVMGR